MKLEWWMDRRRIFSVAVGRGSALNDAHNLARDGGERRWGGKGRPVARRWWWVEMAEVEEMCLVEGGRAELTLA